ncbi:MAG: anti-sigma F factor [Clostridia bacterium]|nr:anti-sigma F factor [Clostridia bacterium]
MNNKIELIVNGILENVSVVRVCIAAFLAKQNITIDELSDIKTAVSEAVTNSIEHGYVETKGNVNVIAKIANVDNMVFLVVEVKDNGIGIQDVGLATTPAYTSKPELEHAGMGFTIMETFMDEVVIDSTIGQGTKITMTKRLRTVKE